MTKNRDFDFGMDNAELDESIQQACEFEQSKQLAEDIRQSLNTLKSIDLSLKLLGSSLAELQQDADCLNADLNDKVRQLQNALTLTIPPETTEHLNDVFTIFCKTFDKTLQEKMNTAIQKAEQDFNATEKRMMEQTNRIVDTSNKVVLSHTFSYVCLTLLITLVTFFGITWWINANMIFSLELQKLCYVFAALTVAIIVCVVLVHRKYRQ